MFKLLCIILQVFLSTRRGSWVINRISAGGLPTEYVYVRRFVIDILHLLPQSVRNGLAERQCNSRFDHVLYGLKPKHRFDAQHVMVNDEFSNRIAAGTVVIKPNIRRLTETGVEFEDGSVVDDVDIVFYATGYEFGFPFMDHPAFGVENNRVSLFKYVFPPDIQPSTVAVIGCIQPLGAVFPISEQQARWAIRVFKVMLLYCFNF